MAAEGKLISGWRWVSCSLNSNWSPFTWQRGRLLLCMVFSCSSENRCLCLLHWVHLRGLDEDSCRMCRRRCTGDEGVGPRGLLPCVSPHSSGGWFLWQVLYGTCFSLPQVSSAMVIGSGPEVPSLVAYGQEEAVDNGRLQKDLTWSKPDAFSRVSSYVCCPSSMIAHHRVPPQTGGSSTLHTVSWDWLPFASAGSGLQVSLGLCKCCKFLSWLHSEHVVITSHHDDGRTGASGGSNPIPKPAKI